MSQAGGGKGAHLPLGRGGHPGAGRWPRPVRGGRRRQRDAPPRVRIARATASSTAATAATYAAWVPKLVRQMHDRGDDLAGHEAVVVVERALGTMAKPPSAAYARVIVAVPAVGEHAAQRPGEHGSQRRARPRGRRHPNRTMTGDCGRSSIAVMSHAPTQQDWMEAPPAGGISAGRAMGWLFFISSLLWPRVGILAFWVFSNLLGRAYDGWVLPVLGFLLLPWTTIAYALMWGLSSDRVVGAEWLVVALALLVDVITHLGWRALRS